MEEERIQLSQRERDRLRVLHELEQGHLQQREAARRLRLSERQIRRLQRRLQQEGDGGLIHGLRGRKSNRKISEDVQRRALRQLGRRRYAGFGPTLASEPSSTSRNPGGPRDAAEMDESSGAVATAESTAERAACVASPVNGLRRTGHDGQLPLPVARRSRSGLPSDRAHRRCHQSRVGAFRSA